MCASDDELGVILGHEIAHSLLCHAAENVTRDGLIEWIKVLLIGLSWALLPTDIISAFASLFSADLTDIALKLPYDR